MSKQKISLELELDVDEVVRQLVDEGESVAGGNIKWHVQNRLRTDAVQRIVDQIIQERELVVKDYQWKPTVSEQVDKAVAARLEELVTKAANAALEKIQWKV